MELLELPHFALGTPMEVAVPSVPNISLCDRLETKFSVVPRRKLVCDSLVLNETLCTRLANCLLIEPHGVRFSNFEACDLRIDECCGAPEVLRANLGPLTELFVVRLQPCKQIAPLFGRDRRVERRKR